MSVPSLKLSPIQVTVTRETISRTCSGGRRDICTLITPSDTSRQSLVIFLASPSNNNSLRFFLSYSLLMRGTACGFWIFVYILISIATKFGAHVSKVGKARQIFSLVSYYNVWSKIRRANVIVEVIKYREDKIKDKDKAKHSIVRYPTENQYN